MIPYIITLSAVSLITFLCYGLDKCHAKRELWRIPEITLLTLTALGGGVGALLGGTVFHHKSNKANKFHFAAVLTLSLVLQIGTGILLFLGKEGA